MNLTIVMKTIEQRLRSPVRMTLSGLLFALPLIALWAAPVVGLRAVENGAKFAFILGAGLLGQDLSAGVLQLLFARPVPRWTYVVSRWLACVTLAGAITAVQVLAGGWILQAHGFPLGTSTMLTTVGTQVLAALGIVSVLTLLSSLLGGFGDLALYLLFNIAGGAFQVAGQFSGREWARRTGEEIGRFLSPGIDLGVLIHATSISWFSVTSFLSTITLCLALAIVLVNRKELSYASTA